MTDPTIPPEALEAHAKVLHAFDIETWMIEQPGTQIDDYNTWDEMTEAARENYRKLSRAACLSMLRNWPGSDHLVAGEIHDKPVIILPLPQENADV